MLHCHDYKSLTLGLLAGTATRTPVVATYHGDTAESGRVRAYEALARTLARFCIRVVTVSEEMAAKLRRHAAPGAVCLIPNPAPDKAPCTADEREQSRRALSIDASGYVVCSVGRLSPEKGHEVLLRALASMASPPLVLLAGDGPLRGSLERAAMNLPVRFLGYVEFPRAVLAAADLLVLPSLREGMPMVVLEALAAGRCVVASGVGTIPAVVGDAGIIVPAGDASALADALNRLRDPAVRDLLASAAPRRVAPYAAEAVARAYADRVYWPAVAAAGGLAPDA